MNHDALIDKETAYQILDTDILTLTQLTPSYHQTKISAPLGLPTTHLPTLIHTHTFLPCWSLRSPTLPRLAMTDEDRTDITTQAPSPPESQARHVVYCGGKETSSLPVSPPSLSSSTRHCPPICPQPSPPNGTTLTESLESGSVHSPPGGIKLVSYF